MELPMWWKSKKFLLFCTVSIILVMTFLWLSHHKPFEYNNKAKRPFLTGKTPGALLYPVTGRVNSETRPVQTVSQFFPTLSTLQVQSATKERMDKRNGTGKDTHASNMLGAKVDAGNDKVPTFHQVGGTQDDAKTSLRTETQTNAVVRLPPKDTHASNMPGAKVDAGNDKVPTFHQDTGTQNDDKKSLRTETQTNAAVTLPPKDTHASNMPGHPGANIDGGNDKVSTFHQDAGTQDDAKTSLRTETQTNAAVTLPPKDTHASIMPGAKIDAVSDEVPTFPRHTTTTPITPTTATTAPPAAPPTPPPVSLRLPSGRMLTPEGLSLPESSSDVLITMKTARSSGEPRLSLAFLTWMQTIDSKHVHIITDSGAGRWFSAAKERGISVIETSCPVGHQQTALCCKSGAEFEQYYLARDRGEHYKWLCHTDDDVYINMPNLVKKLHSYTSGEKRYLGYWLSSMWGQGRMTNGNYNNFPGHVRKGYYYGTGAFYCMTASLMDAAEKYFRGKDAFVSSCTKANLPDDDTVGLITDAVLDVPLTHVKEMNSELSYKTVPAGAFKDQISFGYSIHWNVRINVPNERFSRSDDPSGMLSYHCLLYPQTSWCTK